jgi:hypothetical protein
MIYQNRKNGTFGGELAIAYRENEITSRNLTA